MLRIKPLSLILLLLAPNQLVLAGLVDNISVSAEKNSIAVVVTGDGPVNIDYPLEKFIEEQNKLRSELQSLLAELKAQPGSLQREKDLLEAKLQIEELTKRLNSEALLNKAHRNKIAELVKEVEQFEAWRGVVDDKLIRQGQLLLAQGKKDEALSVYDQITSDRLMQKFIRVQAKAFYKKCLIRRDRNELNLALQECTRAQQLDPTQWSYTHDLAHVVQSLGNTERSAQLFEQAVALIKKYEPENDAMLAKVKLDLSGMYLMQMEFTKASETLEFLQSYYARKEPRGHQHRLASFLLSVSNAFLGKGSFDIDQQLFAVTPEQLGTTCDARKFSALVAKASIQFYQDDANKDKSLSSMLSARKNAMRCKDIISVILADRMLLRLYMELGFLAEARGIVRSLALTYETTPAHFSESDRGNLALHKGYFEILEGNTVKGLQYVAESFSMPKIQLVGNNDIYAEMYLLSGASEKLREEYRFRVDLFDKSFQGINRDKVKQYADAKNGRYIESLLFMRSMSVHISHKTVNKQSQTPILDIAIAQLLLDLGDYSRAFSLLTDVSAYIAEKFGKENLFYAGTLYLLGEASDKLRNSAQALTYFDAAGVYFNKILTITSVVRLEVNLRIAQMNYQLGKTQTAEKMLDQLGDVILTHYEQSHPLYGRYKQLNKTYTDEAEGKRFSSVE